MAIKKRYFDLFLDILNGEILSYGINKTPFTGLEGLPVQGLLFSHVYSGRLICLWHTEHISCRRKRGQNYLPDIAFRALLPSHLPHG